MPTQNQNACPYLSWKRFFSTLVKARVSDRRSGPLTDARINRAKRFLGLDSINFDPFYRSTASYLIENSQLIHFRTPDTYTGAAAFEAAAAHPLADAKRPEAETDKTARLTPERPDRSINLPPYLFLRSPQRRALIDRGGRP